MRFQRRAQNNYSVVEGSNTCVLRWVFTYSLLSPLCGSLFTWQLVDTSGQSIQLFRKSWGAGRKWGEVRGGGVRGSGPRRHAVTWPLWRHAAAAATLPYLTRTPHCWRALIWLVCCADMTDARTGVVSYSACWLSPPPLQHLIYEADEPVLLMALLVFFLFWRPFGDWVGLRGREESGRHWEGKGINTTVGNVFLGNYNTRSAPKIHIDREFYRNLIWLRWNTLNWTFSYLDRQMNSWAEGQLGCPDYDI